MTWIDFVADNEVLLRNDNTKVSRILLALFDLYSEYVSGGLTQYLMNDSADYFLEIKKIFSEYEYQNGLEWVADLESSYGSEINPNRDDRLMNISSMSGYDEGDDPFESEDQKLSVLIPEINNLAEKIFNLYKSREFNS